MHNYKVYLDFFMSSEERESFQLLPGIGQVIISAPHSVEQTREGRSKFAEYQTGVIARLLNDSIHCPVIYKTYNCGDDANYDAVSEYKEELCRYVRENGIRFLLDLHQLAPWRKENVNLGTAFGDNIVRYPELLEIAERHFTNGNIDHITVDYPFDASYPYTVSSFVAANCNIPCLQIELNSRLVCDAYEDFCLFDIVDALKKIVEELNEVVL